MKSNKIPKLGKLWKSIVIEQHSDTLEIKIAEFRYPEMDK